MTGVAHLNPIERAERSLHGLSVGDAFGERFFGPTADVVTRIHAHRLPDAPWRYTDDTIMALSVVETLQRFGAIDQDSLARAFARKYARDPARGYGRMAHEILTAIAEGVPWGTVAKAAFGGQGSMGNGGAMRAGPIGAYFAADLERAALEAKRSAEVTHAHLEGQAGAIAVAVFAACVAGGERSAGRLFNATLEHTPHGPTRDGIALAAELPSTTASGRAAELLGSGQEVVAHDTVPFSLFCAARHIDSFDEALWTTVAGLGDRDTTCAIVGSIVAVAAEHDPVPQDWLGSREPLELMRDEGP